VSTARKFKYDAENPVVSILTTMCYREHIRRCHVVIRCLRCFAIFNTEIEREKHFSQYSINCVLGTDSLIERDQYCDVLQWKMLKKELSRTNTIANQWKDIYRIIFEVKDKNAVIPSPCKFRSPPHMVSSLLNNCNASCGG
jgi:hypothetical protein